jgi:hypothetical protein
MIHVNSMHTFHTVHTVNDHSKISQIVGNVWQITTWILKLRA